MSKRNQKQTKSLRKETISGSAWGFLDKGVGIGVHFIIGIVLARLLPPSDFGLLGLGMIVIGFGEIFVNLGLGSSLIQRQNITKRHVRVVFTTSVIAGVFLSVLVATGAPVAAWILDNEQMVPIVKALSVIFIISGLHITGRALLKKAMDFRSLFYISLLKSFFYGSVTIVLALMGFGVWSLVIGAILSRGITFLGTYFVVRHSVIPLFAKKEFFDLAYFGSGETLSSISNYFALQGDYLMIGRILGSQDLGLYMKSYSLMQMPTNRFVSVLTDVLFPAASQIQDDKKKLGKVFLKTMEIIAFFTFPTCIILVLLAPELIVGLYGGNWEGAILPLQILGGFGVFRAMYNASASFLKARGWVYKIFYTQLIYGFTVLAGVWFAANYFGLKGAALAVGLAIFLMWGMLMKLNSLALDIMRSNIYKTLMPGAIVALCLTGILIPFKIIVYTWTSDTILQLLILAPFTFLILLGLYVLLPQKWVEYLPHFLLKMIEGYMPSYVEKKYAKLLIFLSE